VAVASAGPYASLHLAPDRQPHQHPTTLFLQAGCPSCRPTNSVKALKALVVSIVVQNLVVIDGVVSLYETFNILRVSLENVYSRPPKLVFFGGGGISPLKWGVVSTKPLKGTPLR